MNTEVTLELEHPDLLAGLVEARGVSVAPSDEALIGKIEKAIGRAREAADSDDSARLAAKKAIRDLLRFGGFKPAGRNKPASEYLAGCALKDDAFPKVNNLVDVNNLVSLESGLPISIVDTDLALEKCEKLSIRFGSEKESYVFNRTGQEIDVGGLINLARYDGSAIANAVKDSMGTKTHDETTNILGVIWASRTAPGEEALLALLGRFASLLSEHAGAITTDTLILSNEGFTST